MHPDHSAPKERRRRRAGKRSPKRVFLEIRFALKTPENLKWEEKNGLSKTPFWTTVSPHDAFSAPLAHPHQSMVEMVRF